MTTTLNILKIIKFIAQRLCTFGMVGQTQEDNKWQLLNDILFHNKCININSLNYNNTGNTLLQKL